MCGIAGKLWYRAAPGLAQAEGLARDMAQAVAYRGPDAEGVWVHPDPLVCFSHRRLAIIDLDPRSNQPMVSADGRLSITFNGEIYNFQALRDELIRAHGCRFSTASDTEVLLYLYKTLGPERAADYLGQLRGMFAFALWDSDEQVLLLARDALGKKPLYYAETGDGLVFGSAIKALRQDGSLTLRPNPAALALYLRLGYVPAPLTAFDGICKLPAGHYLLAGPAGIRQVAPYWQPAFEPKLDLPEGDLIRGMDERLAQAVRLRMISDVPIGAFLSGGVDSSAVVACMSRLSEQPVKTFSVSFAGTPNDESAHARAVAGRFGCDHTELEVELRPEHLPDLVWHFEEPFADAAAVPTYFMSQAARRHVTVVLNGDGGDENFAGYTLRHRAYAMAEALRLPNSVRGLVSGLAGWLPSWASEASVPYRLQKSLRVLGGADWRRNLALMDVFPESGGNGLNGQGVPGAFSVIEQHWQAARRLRGLDRELYLGFVLHLAEQLLVKVDRAAMAWALEVRSPLLDQDLVDFCARIDASRKLDRKTSKRIFKQSLAGVLPDDILRRRKQGFNPPMYQWLRRELRPLVESTLLAGDAYVSEVVPRPLVTRLVREHLAGQSNHERKLYALLNLEVWGRRFLRGERF